MKNIHFGMWEMSLNETNAITYQFICSLNKYQKIDDIGLVSEYLAYIKIRMTNFVNIYQYV